MDTTLSGKIAFRFFGALAEFERDIIQERTRAGLVVARVRGSKGERHDLKADPAKCKKIEMAKALHADPNHSIEDICKTLYISRTTLYRRLGESKTNRGSA
jgi:DNA invertase Pin-like site-specific DNA recombinase